MPTVESVENPIRTPLISFNVHLSEDAIIGVFITNTVLQMAQELAEPIKSEYAKRPSAAKAENEQSGETYL